LGRKTLRNAFVLKMKKQEQARRGTKIEGGSKAATEEADEVPPKQRAGYPLVPTKVKPEEWKTISGKKIEVDMTRCSWLPDDYGQGVKCTNPISRSKPGRGGTYTVYINPEGRVFYHQWAIEDDIGRKLTFLDGFKGQVRMRMLQTKLTQEAPFFNILSPAERKHLPKADEFHFCIVSARRTRTREGVAGIASVQAAFRHAGVEPTWYVDADSLAEYRKLGLKAVVGGKLTPARNLALKNAAKLGKACVQCSDDISIWEYHEGKQATERSDTAANAAHKNATRFVISPVAAARFMLAKMRGSGRSDGKEKQRPHLAGVYPLGSCARAFGGEPFSGDNFIIGDFFVVDTASPIRFDEKLTLKEDYDLTCQHIQRHGAVLRCNRMTISAKHQVNAGGACSIRNAKEEQANMAILFEKWPQAIKSPNEEERSGDSVAQGSRQDGAGAQARSVFGFGGSGRRPQQARDEGEDAVQA
jgi:hypothetical protein